MGGRTGESKLQSGVALMASRSSSSHLVLSYVPSLSTASVSFVSLFPTALWAWVRLGFLFVAAYLATVFVFVDMKG